MQFKPDDWSTKEEDAEKVPLIDAEELKPLAIAEDELSDDSDQTKKESQSENDENFEANNE